MMFWFCVLWWTLLAYGIQFRQFLIKNRKKTMIGVFLSVFFDWIMIHLKTKFLSSGNRPKRIKKTATVKQMYHSSTKKLWKRRFPVTNHLMESDTTWVQETEIKGNDKAFNRWIYAPLIKISCGICRNFYNSRSSLIHFKSFLSIYVQYLKQR